MLLVEKPFCAQHYFNKKWCYRCGHYLPPAVLLFRYQWAIPSCGLQETRGLTRSDDISRLLPSEAATLARGKRVRQSKLLFFAKVWQTS